jgi:radical SAM superfamily enzyme YgiQ (UPF0313 family)
MKILLTHAYYIHSDKSEMRIMKPYPPLGILFISSYLKSFGYDVTLYDSTFKNFEDQKRFITELRPDVIGIYCNLMTKLNVIPLMKFIKSEDILKNTKIVLGGPEPPHHAENFLNSGADFVVEGEGEETMKELCESIELSESNFEKVNGILYKGTNGNLIKTPPREKIKNIDVLPMPDRDGIDLTLYLDTWKNKHGYNSVSMNTMRGCPYTCKWCSHNVYGSTYKRRSPQKVAEELKLIVDKYNPDYFWFTDDVFTISHKWLFELEDILKKTGLKIRFECISRSDRLNAQVFESLKNLGCFRIWIGAESGSQKVLDLMDRRVNANQVREMIILAKEYGIETGTFIMLGYPGEEKKDIEETIRHLKDSNPDIFLTTVAYPIKGTTLYNEIESSIVINGNWEEMTDRDLKIPNRYSDRFFRYANRYLINEVNFYKQRLSGNASFKKMGKTFIKARVSKIIFKFVN